MDAVSAREGTPVEPQGRPQAAGRGHGSRAQRFDGGAGAVARAPHPADRDAVPAGVRRGYGLQRLLGDVAAAGQRLRRQLPGQVRDLRRDRARVDARAGARRRRESAQHHGAAAGPVVRAGACGAHPARGRQHQRRTPLDRTECLPVRAVRADEARARAVRGDAAGEAPAPGSRSARAGASRCCWSSARRACWSSPSPISAPRW